MTFKFTIDPQHVKKHNEYFKDIRRLKISGLIYGLLMIVLGVVAYLGFHGDIWGILIGLILVILGVVGLITGPMVASHVGKPQAFYDSHALIPAMVAKLDRNSAILLGIADLPQGGRALIARHVNKVEDVRRIGARIPSVAAGNKKGTEITIVPIAWGTTDKAVIDEAKHTLPEAQWNELRRYLDRVDEVLATPRNLLPLKD
ncbi:MAG: DUF3239 domain-containing protein [Corynebacterium sp.]|nr:DUF3239 domain-containing protein [Corynebacterium sp.]